MNSDAANGHVRAWNENLTLESLRRGWQDNPDAWLDTQWGVSRELREDGAARIVPLTLARLDEWAARVWVNPRDNDGSWSLRP